MERIYGMDIWRGSLLCAGVFVHCAQLIEAPVFRMFAEISHVFRMEAFFAISGFFAALTVRKGGSGTWLRRRIVMLGVPLIVGLTLIVPSAHYLEARIDEFANLDPRFISPWPPRDLYIHIWFLLALLLYTPLAVLANAQQRLVDQFCALVQKHPNLLIAMLWVGEALFCIALTSIIARHTGTHTFIVRQIFYFVTFYAIGFCVQRSPEFREQFLKPRMWVYVAAAAALIMDLVVVGSTRDGRTVLWTHLAVRPIIGFAATSLIFRSAFALKECRNWQALLSQASYTIYLLHVPILLLVLFLAASASPPPILAFAVIPLLTIVLLFYFHHLFVQRNAIASFLLNGKLPTNWGWRLQQQRG